MRLIARCISLTAWSSSNLHKTLPYSGQAASKIQLPPEKAVAGKEFLQNEELKLLGYIFELTVMHKLLWHPACYHADSLSIRVHHILLTLTGNPTCYQLQRPFVQHTHCSQVSDGGAAAIFMSEEAMSFFVADLFVGTLKLGKLLWMPGLEEVWPDSWVCSGDCGFRLWSRQSMAEAVKHHPKKNPPTNHRKSPELQQITRFHGAFGRRFMVWSNGPFGDGHYKDSRLGFCTKVVAQWLRVIMVCLITTHGL